MSSESQIVRFKFKYLIYENRKKFHVEMADGAYIDIPKNPLYAIDDDNWAHVPRSFAENHGVNYVE